MNTVSNEEMTEILENNKLMKNLRKSPEDIKKGKYRIFKITGKELESG